MGRSRRRWRPFSLVLLDIDHFKAINDSHGHQTGDEVLINFATGTREMLRPSDALGRFGGEEFVALLPETDLPQARLVAERIRARCAQSSGATAHTVSIGLAITASASDTVRDMLRRADLALYRAKAQGRNLVEVG